MDLQQIAKVCAAECERQHVGLDRVAMLINGLVYAQQNANRPPLIEDVLTLAGMIEPDSKGQFRWTPVTFANGNTGTPADSVPGAVSRLIGFLADGDVDATEWIRQFEVIHPFTDGNGRTGFVLYNWLNGTLDAPDPLPHFQF